MRTINSRHNAISFLPVDPKPCDRITGGTIFGKVGCLSFGEPIGWIVRSSIEIPLGDPSFAKPPVAWHFLPTCGIEPVLSGCTDQGALQNAVRKQYRGFYDRLSGNSRKRVATGDDCEVDEMILKWCGVSDFWDEHSLSEDYSVIKDVLDSCDSADYSTREWYGGGPGLSGVWYSVYTMNPALFIREVRMKSEELFAEKLAKPLPAPSRKSRRSSKPSTPEMHP